MPRLLSPLTPLNLTIENSLFHLNLGKERSQRREYEEGEQMEHNNLTVAAFLLIGLSADAELLLQNSSLGGGNTLPDRRCILLMAPAIC